MQNNQAIAQQILSALLFGILAAMPAGAVVTFDETSDLCALATPVDVNRSLRILGNEGTAAHTFEIEVPFPGLVTMDVAVQGSALAEPKLDFLGQGCAGPVAEGDAFAVIKRSAASLVLAVRVPGSYLFRVIAQDPLLPLEEYKLITGFLAETVDDEGLCGLKDEDESEEEPDPNPQPVRVDPCQKPAAGFVLKDEDESEEEPDPNPLVYRPDPCQGLFSGIDLKDEDETEDEPEPNPNPHPAPKYDLSHASAALRSKLDVVCRSGEIAADHGDTFICATAFCPGLEVAGEIRNGWGDDHDVFMFVLTEQQTVAVETTGFTDTFGGLYDRYGHRLGRADDGGSGDNFRIAKTLSPGIYFVRVEGRDGAEGVYTLTVKTLNWKQ